MTSHERPKVFVIGLNKTATTSIHRAFKASGYVSWHRTDGTGRPIAKLMQTNVLARRPILSGLGDFDVLSDLTHCDETEAIEAAWYYKELHLEYPDAYFLLNFRDRDSWIRSRRNHAGLYRGQTYIERSMSAYRASEQELETIWGHLHDQFHPAVRTYFNRTDANFLEFNIAIDKPEKIATWLGSHYKLSEQVWAHAAKGAPGSDRRSRLRKRLSRAKWSLIARME